MSASLANAIPTLLFHLMLCQVEHSAAVTEVLQLVHLKSLQKSFQEVKKKFNFFTLN